jgi:hypothetical protein
MKFIFLVLFCLISLITPFKYKLSLNKKNSKTEMKNKPLKKILTNENTILNNYGAVYKDKNGNFILSASKLNDNSQTLVAECYFNKVIDKKGWDKISINTFKSANSYQQAFLAGYLEGRMTADDIFNFYNNLRQNNMRKHKAPWDKMYNFFNEVAVNFSKRIHDMRNNPKAKSYEDRKFWSRIILGYTQLEGLVKGYSFEINKKGNFEEMKMTMADFLILQADGEVPELLRYFGSIGHHSKIGSKNYFKDAFGIDTQNPMDFWSQLMWTSKCSAFIKLTKDSNGNWNDLLAGHTTWTEYYEMLRTYKQYLNYLF